MKLAIISHTEHYLLPDGSVVGTGHTVREVNHLLEVFDEIIHLAPLYKGPVPVNVLAYSSSKIKFIPLKEVGGAGILNKLKIIALAPINLRIIHQALKGVDWVQFRAPTSMGLYVLPYLSLIKKPNRWVKYAGNWGQPHAPLSYKMQRWFLTHNFQRSKVTINGKWPHQPNHLISFLNPCLTTAELEMASTACKTRSFQGKLNFCFVGRLEEAKGPQLLLEAFQHLNADRIGYISLIGAGPLEAKLKEFAESLPFKIHFLGELKRDHLNQIYATHHFFILPSKSEGFPKVVAEAASFGCIPLVTDMSGIGQVIKNEENGFLLQDRSAHGLHMVLEGICELPSEKLSEMSQLSSNLAANFSYTTYNQRILTEIVQPEK